ncbi:hypothetical protein FI667_g3969, partial [Globisporangium splendens]
MPLASTPAGKTMEMNAWVNGRVGDATPPAVNSKAAQQTTEDVPAPATPSKQRKAMDIKELLDELPSLSALKDKQWMKKFAPAKMFTKSPRNANASSMMEEEGEEGDESGGASVGRDGSFYTQWKSTLPASAEPEPMYDDDILTTLDPRFFTESFDAVAFMLENIPTSQDELDLFLRTEISAVDVAKDVIVSKLADDVRANHDSFIQGMKQVQEVDLDLVRAQIHVKNGRRLLTTAKNDLILSALEIVKLKRNRDRVEEIIDSGNQVLELFEEEQRMNDALQNNSFTIAYKELLHAYITLAEHSENLGFEFSSLSLNEVLSNIPEIIVRCIDDITRQFVSRRFDQKKSPKKSKGKKKALHKRSKKDQNGLSPAAKAIDDVTQCFERLTNLMHTFYLLVQWHRDPFNPKNDDLEYLHRCGIDDDDDDDDGDDDESNEENEHHNNEDGFASGDKAFGGRLRKLLSPRTKRSSSISSESSTTQRSPYSQILCETGMTLLRYRKIVWENMQQNVMEVLDRLDMTYGFKMEHIIALSHATNTFINIGEEFTGAAATKLRSCIRIKCEQYLSALHDDNTELIRMLLDTENWQRVMTHLEDGDSDIGLMRLIEKRSGYRFEMKAREEFTMDPIYARRVFPSFHADGNPFSASNSSQWLSLDTGIRFQYEKRPIAVKTEKAGHEDTENNNQEDSVLGDEHELVLNSSTLSGFIRFCGVYLKMMEHLPAIAWDIMLMLNRLFEFYSFAVFTSFLDQETIIHLFRERSDDGAGLGRWNGLKINICRIAEEMHTGETFLQTSIALFPDTVKPHGNKRADIVEKAITLRRITRVPSALEHANETNLYGLAERCIACEVVCTQVRLLKAIEATARSYLPDRYHCLMEDLYARNKALADELRSFMYKSIATKLVDVPSVLQRINQISWDIEYISEHHNEYIVHLVQKCGEAWGGLQILADGSIPVDAREEIWSGMVQTIMETLLDGFAGVPKCTPQGRALMSMDLHALQNGLDLINHISSTAVPRGREYVNNYIKAFYYDDVDLLQWIKENKGLYSKLRLVNLIKNGVGPKMQKQELKEFVLKVDEILSAS